MSSVRGDGEAMSRRPLWQGLIAFVALWVAAFALAIGSVLCDALIVGKRSW